MTLALLVAVLAVTVGGPAEDPAYLPVHAAAALGTFEAEGVTVALRRAKHPAAAVDALRAGAAAVAVTTADRAVRGAWTRGAPVRVLVAHTRAPACAFVVSAKHRDRIRDLSALRGQRVGIPGPGTTGHLLLARLLARLRIGPADLQLVSLGGAATVARLAAGDIAAAVLEEPWATRAVEAGAGQALIDFRRPEETVRQLGGPFYEVVSVVRADERALADAEAALAAYARALVRVLAWLAVTPAAAVAERLPAGLLADPGHFVARLDGARAGYAADGEASETGLRTTLEVLRAGSPWPVTLKLAPADLREPAFVSAGRARLGPTPPPP